MYYYYVDTPEQVCTGDSGWTGARSARVESPRNVALGFVRYAVSGVSHGYSCILDLVCAVNVAVIFNFWGAGQREATYGNARRMKRNIKQTVKHKCSKHATRPHISVYNTRYGTCFTSVWSERARRSDPIEPTHSHSRTHEPAGTIPARRTTTNTTTDDESRAEIKRSARDARAEDKRHDTRL